MEVNEKKPQWKSAFFKPFKPLPYPSCRSRKTPSWKSQSIHNQIDRDVDFSVKIDQSPKNNSRVVFRASRPQIRFWGWLDPKQMEDSQSLLSRLQFILKFREVHIQRSIALRIVTKTAGLKGTVEERMEAVQARKQQMISADDLWCSD